MNRFAIFGVFVVIFSQTFSMLSAQNTVSASSGETIYVSDTGTPVVVDATINVTASATIENAMVVIGSGFVALEDILEYPTVLYGVVGEYDSSTGILSLSGSATAAQYREIFRSIRYKNANTHPAPGHRRITFSLGEALPFYPCGATEPHFYQLIHEHGNDWTIAKADAESRTYYGYSGYLATIICEDENTFITQKLDASAFIGASDAGKEDTWEWMCGPEIGTIFWKDNVTQTYANWNPSTSEPNNTGGAEHCACIYGLTHPTWGSAGLWNDVRIQPGANDLIVGYVLEYGGLPDDPVQSIADEKLVMVETYPLLNLDVSGSTVCEGSDAFLTVENSEIGVQYIVYQNLMPIDTLFGTGADILFNVQASSLSVGTNTLRIEASNSAYSGILSQNGIVNIIAYPFDNLNVISEAICSETDGLIVISDSESDVVYQAHINENIVGEQNGNGSSLQFTISESFLNNGDNTAEIYARRGDCSVILQDTANVRVNGFELLQIASEGSQIQAGTDGTIILTESEPDVLYLIQKTDTDTIASTVTGIGAQISTTVSAEYLHVGENYFDIYAVNGMCKINVGSEIIQVKDVIVIPGGFSPNGNGVNEQWTLQNIGNFPDNTVQVFNRWGILVFEGKAYDNQTVVWKGECQNQFDNGSSQLPEGTFFYVINPGDSSAVIKGNVYVKY